MANSFWEDLKASIRPEVQSRANLWVLREMNRINNGTYGKRDKPLRRTAVIKATRRLGRLRANHARMRHILRAKDVVAKREAAAEVYKVQDGMRGS